MSYLKTDEGQVINGSLSLHHYSGLNSYEMKLQMEIKSLNKI